MLLTGAAGALGRAFAARLAAEGAGLAVLDIDPAVEALAAEHGARAIVADLAVDDVASAVDAAAEALGGLDAVINNAAVFGELRPRPLADLTAAEIDRVLAVNVRAVLLVCQAAAPHLAASGRGRIVNVGSGSILTGAVGYPHYVAAKGAVFALTRALARELGPDGIRVNTVAPGLVATPAVVSTHSTETLVAARQTRALARDEQPDDISGTIVYLLSADSEFVTGQMLVVNGGAQLW
ncbi:MAG: SDR family oxidoreductase [Acidimicrobiaceae bacterium]|nr:SDR family oxidoreductase [Acidimicrobiaceae bacterium]